VGHAPFKWILLGLRLHSFSRWHMSIYLRRDPLVLFLQVATEVYGKVRTITCASMHDENKESTRSSTLSVTVVIPAYNEEANIERLIQQVLDEPWSDSVVLDKLIVVDDCSDDDTPEIIRLLASKHDHLHIIRHEQRSGKNAGIRDGIAACRSDIIAILDADIGLRRGCVTNTVQLLADNSAFAAASCVNEPLQARTWRERASRFQALILTEGRRLGRASLLRVYAIRTVAIRDLVLPDTTHDDLYIPRWLRNHGYRYAVNPQAIAYTRSATGLRDFAKQTLRAWQALDALERVLPITHPIMVEYGGRLLTLRIIVRAIRREPLGFLLYVLWRGIVTATPTTLWLPTVEHTKHDQSASTKDLGI